MRARLRSPAVSTVGPARSYAKVGATAVAAVAGTVGADGKPVEVPKEGPAAFAVGRAVAAGKPSAARAAKGRALAPIGRTYQIV